MKKKPSAQKSVLRLKIIIAAIFMMLAVIIITRMMAPKSYQHEPSAVEAAMDGQLDSLILTFYGDGVEVLTKGPYEQLPDERNEDSRYRNEITRYEMASAKENIDPAELQKLKEKADKAKEKLMKNKQFSYYRNVIIKMPDSRKKSFYQKMDSGLSASEVILSVTIPENNDTENNINE
jgi:hypothetical protein